MPDADQPNDLLPLLCRLQAEHPGTWLEIIADAVVAVGGTDSADLLSMAADRAATGIVSNATDGDPEQALAELERQVQPDTGPVDMDLLANLPPVTLPSLKPPSRSMEN